MWKSLLFIQMLLLVLYSVMTRVQLTELNIHILEKHSNLSNNTNSPHTDHSHKHLPNSKKTHSHEQELITLNAPFIDANPCIVTSMDFSNDGFLLSSKFNVINHYLYLLQSEILRPPIA